MLGGMFRKFKARLTRRDVVFMTESPAFSAHQVGVWSYGNPQVLSWHEGAQLRVGKYCSVAEGVTILLGGGHRTDWVTTYPFSALWPAGKGIPGHPQTKGDVIIENDVWVGRDALILSGVKIGNGAVIGARSVVAKDVPPYTIVAGNPARVIRERFTPAQREALLKIQWWNWPEGRIRAALPALLCDDIDAFIEEYGGHSKG
jgi:virginiamycin A acetyltransferase